MKKRRILISLIVLMIVSLSLAVGLTVAKYISTLQGEPLIITIDGRQYIAKNITYQDAYAYSVENNVMTVNSTYFDQKQEKWCVVVGVAENGFNTSKYGNGRNITKLEFAENEYLKTIDTNAFSGWSKITEFPIPASVTEFNPSTNMSALLSYVVEDGSVTYSAVDGVLYNDDGTYLIRYPMAKTETGNFFTVPTVVTDIDSGAFDKNPNLNAIIVTYNVAYMEEANWGGHAKTIAIHDMLGVNIKEITYLDGTHTVVLADATIDGKEITQTGVNGTSFDEVGTHEEFTLLSDVYGSGKWVVLDVSTTYAYGVLDSSNVLHIYNRNTIYNVGDTLENDAIVKGVYKTPTNVIGTLHLDDTYLSWNKVYDESSSDYIIKTITSVIVEDKIAPSTLSGWFSEFRECISFDLEKMDTSRVTTMANMFNTCYKIASLDLTHFKTTHVTTMSGMFNNCNKLTELDLSSFSNENLTSIGGVLSAANLQTVYVGEKWLPKDNMQGQPFSSEALTGSKGTIFTSGANTTAYARIDYDEGLPGYFTYKGNPLVRMAIDGIEIEPVTLASDNSAVVTFSENPGQLVRIVSSLRDNTDIYLSVEYKNGEYQITIPASYYTENQLVSVLDVGELLFACLDEDGTLSVYLRQIGIDTEHNKIYFDDAGITKEYSTDKVFSTSITVEGAQNIGHQSWTNASADIKKVVFVDEVTPTKDTATSMFANLTACVEFDLSNLDVSNMTSMSGMFQSCKAMRSIIWADDIDTSKLTNMNLMFKDCSALENYPLSENFNTANVKYMQWTFGNCSSLESLVMPDSFDTSSVTDMQNMFNGCKALKSITWSVNFKTGNVQRMDAMFGYCEALEILVLPTTFDTQNVTSMSNMFRDCYKLKNLSFDAGTFNTSKVSAMGGMFRSCYALTAEDFYEIFNYFTETTSVTNIGAMFYGCTGLTEFAWPEILNTSKVTYMREVFQGCTNLVTVDLTNLDTTLTTNIQQFFNQCSSLTTIYVASSWNTNIVTEYVNAFSGCTNLVGGNGTIFDRNIIGKDYARIDGENGLPGYFTVTPHDNHGTTTYTVNADETHTEYCGVYGEPIKTEAHTYTDGKCVCGKDETNE